tara:strand:- start:3626 stop:3985 length:360 start_codon:yes stop_codon:yes gene_type:complete
MKLKLIAPLLLIVSTLFFVANAYAYAKKLDTNISGLVLKELRCGIFPNVRIFSGRWVNRNNQSLGNKRINIYMYDSDGDRIGVQSTDIINMGAKTGGEFYTRYEGSDCKDAGSIGIVVK